MIQVTKSGAEFSTKLAELRAIEKSEAYRTAQFVRHATKKIDYRLAEARRIEREGKQLLSEGVSISSVSKILTDIDRKEQ